MSGKGTLKSFKAMLAEAKLPEKTVPICLRGDLVAEFEDAERLLEAASEHRNDSLDGGGDVGELAERIEALREQMREDTYTFRLRALPKRDFRALVSDHPPRRVTNEAGDEEFHQQDRFLGVNFETFFDALIRASVVDPELDDADWVVLLQEKLTDKQYDKLADGSWTLNRSDVDIPFSHAASLISRTSVPA
jgi:hypothetical protein